MAERKYSCSYEGCNKTFNRRDYLERHAANHLQIKPFVCEPCDRQFSRKDLYDNHLNTRFHARRSNQNGDPAINEHHNIDKDIGNKKSNDSTIATGSQLQQQRIISSPGSDFFTADPVSLEFGENNATGAGAELASTLMTPSIRPEFESNTSMPFYNSLPGIEGERWDDYRPFKRLPAISDYGTDTSSSKRSHNSNQGPSSTVTSISEGDGSMSDSTNGSVTQGTGISLTSISDQTDQVQAPAPTAYKMWLIDRFQSEEGEETKALREPEKSDPEYDKKYLWFFDSVFATTNGKYGYDRMYSHSNKTYRERALKYHAANWPHNARQGSMPSIDQEGTNFIMEVLAAGSHQVICGGPDIDQYIEIAWSKAHVVSCIVHRPTFNPNTAHPALVAVLVVLGMALSSDEGAKKIAKMVTPNVSLYVYESLNQAEGPMSTRYSVSYVGHFQAFCLLFKYEPIIFGRDLYASSLIRASSCHRSADKFISRLIASVGQLGLAPKDPKLFECKRKPIWASILQEDYAFHEGADIELQWREWAAYEMCKRTVHFTIYCDGVISMSDPDYTGPPISLFNLDIHLVCPDSVWHARNPEEFFYILGPTAMVSNVPFLGVIKSLVRFPRVSPPVSVSIRTPPGEDQAPLSFFAFRMIAHGLMNITSGISGVFSKGDVAMKAVLYPDSSDKSISQLSPFFDLSIQARLYRGLDIWFQYFEMAFGKITDHLFKISGSLGLRITNEIIDDIEDDNKSIPQYALYLVLYHYSSFIMVHEDLPIVLQVTANLAKWLEQDGKLIDQNKLLEFLYMPLYAQWIQSDEARAMVSTGSLFLIWVDAATGQVQTKSWNQLVLSAVIYTSALIAWMFDLVVYYNAHDCDMSNYFAGRVDIQNYDFLKQGMSYLQAVCKNPDAIQFKRNKNPPVLSVLLTSACLLYNRPYTQDLYCRIEQLICVLEPSLTADRVRLVLEGAGDVFRRRSKATTSLNGRRNASKRQLSI